MMPDATDSKRIKSSIGYNGCYKIYFNFDSSVMHVLHFLYTIANIFQAWGSHDWVRIYNQEGQEQDFYISAFDRNFRADFYMSADRMENIADVLIHNLYMKNRILHFPGGKYDKNYIIEKIKKFTKQIQNQLSNRK